MFLVCKQIIKDNLIDYLPIFKMIIHKITVILIIYKNRTIVLSFNVWYYLIFAKNFLEFFYRSQ